MAHTPKCFFDGRTPRCLFEIRKSRDGLRGKYRELANYVLEFPDKIIKGRVKDVAAACGCDDSLVIRFCQKFGYKGLPDLKASIASEFMPVGVKDGTAAKSDEGSWERLKRDFLKKSCRSLSDTASMIDDKAMTGACEICAKAKRIFVFGVGTSGIVAQDAQMKLLRIGLHAVYQCDSSYMTMLAGLADRNDCLLAISYSGETKEVCAAARHFRETGAKVVGITESSSSSLAKLSDVTLQIMSDESAFRLGAMTSRMAQLFAVDLLVVTLAMRDMARSQKNVLKTLSMLREGRNL